MVPNQIIFDMGKDIVDLKALMLIGFMRLGVDLRREALELQALRKREEESER